MKVETIVDYKNIKLFEGLNSLRFLAAFLVVIHHGETIRAKNCISNFINFGLFKNGGNAVSFFFVLSGFLITYLLLKEKENNNNISVSNFYLKRILRIWPLYFLMVFIGTIVLKEVFSFFQIEYIIPYNLRDTWFYFFFFLPGMITYIYGHHILEPLWSVGVEEIFYLFWAPLFKYLNKYIMIIMVSIIVVKTSILIIIYHLNYELFSYLTNLLKFESMAIGGIGAYLIFHHGSYITKSIIFKLPIQFFCFSIITVFLLFNFNINNFVWTKLFKTPIFSPLIIDLLFLYIIICISLVDNSIIKLRNRLLALLGDISYGIYMYHMFVIFGVIHFFKNYLMEISSPWSHIGFYFLVFSLTISGSFLSKVLIENYFLKLKSKIFNII